VTVTACKHQRDLILKVVLARLLLALSLTANSVAVLAGGLDGIEIAANPARGMINCHSSVDKHAPGFQMQHDGVNCSKPCCDESACSMQDICIVQHSAVYLAQTAPDFRHPVVHHGRDARLTAVPDQKAPPENPPPIHS